MVICDNMLFEACTSVVVLSGGRMRIERGRAFLKAV
jgi:hypothetical protein